MQIGLPEYYEGVSNPYPWMSEVIDLMKEKQLLRDPGDGVLGGRHPVVGLTSRRATHHGPLRTPATADGARRRLRGTPATAQDPPRFGRNRHPGRAKNQEVT